MDSIGRIQTTHAAVMPCFRWVFVIPKPGPTAIYCYVIIFSNAKNTLEAPFRFGGWVFEDAPVIEIERDDIIFSRALVVN